jgi:RNA polymerase sigma factor (sigma-70 family)
MTHAQESSLIARYQAGDEKAFEELVYRHKNKVFTTVLLIVRDRYVAEDLLQETFIKVIQVLKGGKYNEEGKFGGWVCRVAHNLAIDYVRKEKRTPTILLEDGSNVFNALSFSASSAESVQIQEETVTNLKALIQQLPAAQREVLIMRTYGEMTFQEIADSTGVSINTALGRMRYALLHLRKKLTLPTSSYDKNLYPS